VRGRKEKDGWRIRERREGEGRQNEMKTLLFDSFVVSCEFVLYTFLRDKRVRERWRKSPSTYQLSSVVEREGVNAGKSEGVENTGCLFVVFRGARRQHRTR
jgi:hypothetical protein